MRMTGKEEEEEQQQRQEGTEQRRGQGFKRGIRNSRCWRRLTAAGRKEEKISVKYQD